LFCVHSKRNMSVERLKNIQLSLAQSGVKRITYVGGEPFLKKELLMMSAHAQSCGLSTAVVTNGTHINRSVVEEIIRRKIFDIMIFSLDGPEFIHDSIRAIDGTFKRATDTIKNVQKLKKIRKIRYPKVFINVTISALNYDYIEPMLSIAQQLDVNAIRFLSLSCLDDTIIKKTNALFGYPAIKTHLYAVGNSFKIPEKKLPAVIEKLAHMKERAKKIGIKFQVEKYLQNGKGADTCSFLGKDFVISPYGDIYPCPMLPEYIIGNDVAISLDKMLCDNSIQDKVKRIFELASNKTLPVCSQCCVEKVSLPNNAVDICKKQMLDG